MMNVIGRATNYVGAVFRRLQGPVQIACIRREGAILNADGLFGSERGLRPDDQIGVTYMTDPVDRPNRLYFVSPADLECFAVIGTHTKFMGGDYPEYDGLEQGQLVEIRYLNRDCTLYSRDLQFGGAPGITARDEIDIVPLGIEGQPLGERLVTIEARDLERFTHLRGAEE
jgi:hypothetical protein